MGMKGSVLLSVKKIVSFGIQVVVTSCLQSNEVAYLAVDRASR